MNSTLHTSLSHREFIRLDRNYEKAARAASLKYVSDTAPGIVRIRKGRGYIYRIDRKPLRAKKEIDRIKRLAIPPSWSKVWICADGAGHIQATGFDLRNRKQYRYHPLWTALRNETKFHRLYEFGKALPTLRVKLEQDLDRKELCEERVIATVIALMERTYIRIGNDGYEKLYGSYGLTTLKDKHVAIEGSKIDFSFKGKKGIFHKVTLQNKRLARIVKQCREIPGKELFQYYDAQGIRKSIDSGMVNNYIQQATGFAFTAKDFRTWAGSLHFLRELKALGDIASQAESKKNIITALDAVSKKLGNTRSICRSYYVHPALISLYEENNLTKYLHDLDATEIPDGQADLTADEKVLMKILRAATSGN
ncbi:MAG TPA: DNA topoisomerase IB [Ohtaekwangia sp.]|uniref:DNA topoisomerase IB n=1 Tax=Ohtaekwangia sp. TaxID=2066019 RepID=UPI002F91EED9